jgi:hypothetical protein
LLLPILKKVEPVVSLYSKLPVIVSPAFLTYVVVISFPSLSPIARATDPVKIASLPVKPVEGSVDAVGDEFAIDHPSFCNILTCQLA